jgi:hypothetical protein
VLPGPTKGGAWVKFIGQKCPIPKKLDVCPEILKLDPLFFSQICAGPGGKTFLAMNEDGWPDD